MPALACKTHKKLFLCIWLPLFHPMETKKFNFFLSKYTVTASGGLRDLKTDHLEPLASHSLVHARCSLWMELAANYLLELQNCYLAFSVPRGKHFQVGLCTHLLCHLMLLARVDALTNICWRLWKVTMYPLQFYRPTGSRTRMSPPRKYAPWSTKYRKTALLTAPACKLVT